MNSQAKQSWVATWLLACALLLSAPVLALAEDKTPAEVLVILAKESGATDPELQRIKALQKPPFSGFKSKKVLKKHSVSIGPTGPVEVALPNGRQLQLKMLEKLDDGRVKIQVSINKPKKKDYLPLLQVIASPSEPFFIAGQQFEGGTLIIGVQIGKKPAPAAPKK